MAARDGSSPQSKGDGERLLGASRDKYAALRSYADTAVITTEYRPPNSPPIIEEHHFTTRYRAPRNFYLEFNEDPKAGAERFVIWCDGGDFNSWWSTTRVHEVYTGGRGTLAFALGSQPTRGITSIIPPLLFPRAAMKGPLNSLYEARSAGDEKIANRNARRIAAEARSSFATGLGQHSRATTVWLDVETLLVLKLVQDTPQGTPGGLVIRETTLITPRVNVELDDTQFRFDPERAAA
jgi:hypothetical protein